jgi:hypothetical protein
MVTDKAGRTVVSALERRISEAKAAGEVGEDVDVQTAAQFMKATIVGIKIAARAGATPGCVRGIARRACPLSFSREFAPPFQGDEDAPKTDLGRGSIPGEARDRMLRGPAPSEWGPGGHRPTMMHPADERIQAIGLGSAMPVVVDRAIGRSWHPSAFRWG